MKKRRNEAVLDPLWITARQVADLLSCSVRTVWRWVEVGQLPEPRRWNRKFVRWNKAAVLAFLADLTKEQS